MFRRAVVEFSGPASTQVRGMATLKALSVRLKAVTNIQKITKSMKMVSAAKYARAEKELKPARVYGLGAKEFFEKAELAQDEKKPNHLVIAMTSDRGLCGAVHSNIGRVLKQSIPKKLADGANVMLVCVGDKSKIVLSRLFPNNMLMSFNEIGKKVPTFQDASQIASAILDSGIEFDVGELHFNIFNSVVSYKTTMTPVYNMDQLAGAEKINIYDSIDEDVLRNYNEFALANLIFYAMKEGACSEQSARMTAMDSASKNAGEMIGKLQLTYNRTRQAVITRELVEIISGAAALK